MLCYLIPSIPSHSLRFCGKGCFCLIVVLTLTIKAAEAALVVHRGVEPRFSEPKSGVIPIYEWTALSKKRAKLLQKIQIRKYFCKKMQITLHFCLSCFYLLYF